MKKRLSKTSINGFINYGIVIAAFLLLQLLMAQDMISNTLKSLLVPVCCYIVMAISLNLTVGILGELSLGHAGFMSLGAFSGIVAAMALPEAAPGLRLVIAILVGSIAGALGGVLVGVPVLRLQGDYLAIVTLAFGEIIRNIIVVLYVGLDQKGLHITTDSAGPALGGGRDGHQGPHGGGGGAQAGQLYSWFYPHPHHPVCGAEPGCQPRGQGHHGPAG